MPNWTNKKHDIDHVKNYSDTPFPKYSTIFQIYSPTAHSADAAEAYVSTSTRTYSITPAPVPAYLPTSLQDYSNNGSTTYVPASTPIRAYSTTSVRRYSTAPTKTNTTVLVR